MLTIICYRVVGVEFVRYLFFATYSLLPFLGVEFVRCLQYILCYRVVRVDERVGVFLPLRLRPRIIHMV